MRISFRSWLCDINPFGDYHAYRRVYFLGLWTPLCRRWQGDTSELSLPGFPGKRAKALASHVKRWAQERRQQYRLTQRRFAVRKVDRQAVYELFCSLGSHDVYNMDSVAKKLNGLGFRTTVSPDRMQLELNGLTLYVVRPDHGDPGIDGLDIGMLLYELISGRRFHTDYNGRGWIYNDILAKLGEVCRIQKTAQPTSPGNSG